MPRAGDHLGARAGRLLLWVAGVPVRIEGREHLPPRGPYVAAANHASYLDSLVVALVLPDAPVFAAVAGLAERPLVRLVLRLDARLVARGDRARASPTYGR